MYRKVVCALAAALVAGVGACATSGVSLSSVSYTGQDFATTQYDNLYDFLQAHSRVRVGDSGSTVALAVRDQRDRRMGLSGASNPTGGFSPARDTSARSLGGGGGSSGGGGADFRGAPGGGQFAPALLYIDDRATGAPIQRLRQIAPAQVETLEILRPAEASSRYGGDGRLAIISLTLKQGGS